MDDFGEFATDLRDSDRAKHYEPYLRRIPSLGFKSVLVEALKRRTGVHVREFVASSISTKCPGCGCTDPANIDQRPRIFGQPLGKSEEGPCSIRSCLSMGRGHPALCNTHARCVHLVAEGDLLDLDNQPGYSACGKRGYGNPPRCENHTPRQLMVPQEGRFICTQCKLAMGSEGVALFNTILDGTTLLERGETQPAAPDWARALVAAAIDDYRSVRAKGTVKIEVTETAATPDENGDVPDKTRRAGKRSAISAHP